MDDLNIWAVLRTKQQFSVLQIQSNKFTDKSEHK